MKPITCFLMPNAKDIHEKNEANLYLSDLVEEVKLIPSFTNSEGLRSLTQSTKTPYTLFWISEHHLELGKYALNRLLQVAQATNAGMVYSDYYEQKEGAVSLHPTIDYQDGSLRDDFNFGSLLLFKTDDLQASVLKTNPNFRYAALYDLRLKLSQSRRIFHLSEPLYSVVETDLRKSGEKIFDYVDPKNRIKQLEMEEACTAHLKDIEAWVAPSQKAISFKEDHFEYEASVVIPVRNRAKTITDAINSVLKQQCLSPFNLIIVDNHSNDGTSEIIADFAKKHANLIHLIPQNDKLGIGGCWNEALMHPQCGKFAIQLDSDDLYIDENTVQTIINTFYKEQCAMVIGSYQMVNVKLEEIPPGLIDHKEWTPENGTNNALRINGLGAPRAFYTPVYRDCLIPNTSYGEDYAIGLYLSAEYKIGRIYDPLYLCRRWEENSDSSLDINKTNMHNRYKDQIRTIELYRRMQKK